MSTSAIGLGLRGGVREPRPLARVQLPSRSATAPAQPIAFDAAGSWCFGMLHRAQGEPSGVGAVLCRPLGYEALCSYEAYTQLAEMLAEGGVEALRFDYHGTGDSAGSDADPARVDAWLASIRAAVAELRQRTGIERVALFGLRMGATLAALAAQAVDGVDDLVLWAPCVTGRSFVRELRAANASRSIALEPNARGDMEALGFLYTHETLAALHAIDLNRLQRKPASRVLLVGRDDMPGEGPLPARLRELGAQVSYEPLGGYAAMMVEPHEGKVDEGSLRSIAAWLRAGAPAAAQGKVRPASDDAAFASREAAPGVIERPFTFGPDGSLFGVLSEAAAGSQGLRAQARGQMRGQTALLLLNVGGNYRIGPNRFYVRMARDCAAQGFRVLRFDLPGIGDSRAATRFAGADFFSREAVEDVRAAVDALAAQGCTRFYVIGVCSGSFIAFQSALADDRINGQVLMNSRLLESRDDPDTDVLQASMRENFKSMAYYRRALLQPHVWQRLVRGEVNVRGIARRAGAVMQARIARLARRLAGRAEHERSVLENTRRLGRLGTDTFVIMAAQDDGRDYVEFHFGAQGSRLRGDPNFRMVIVEGCDHTFSTVDAQERVIGMIRDHISHKLAAA